MPGVPAPTAPYRTSHGGEQQPEPNSCWAPTVVSNLRGIRNYRPTCPYCDKPVINMGDWYYDADHECEACGQPYHITIHVVQTYSTTKINPEAK